MRKMPYTLIFLAILVLLVFAGCKAFTPKTNDETEPSTEESVTEVSVTTESTTLPENPEAMTNAAGQTIYTPEEASSIREANSSIAQSAAQTSSGAVTSAGSTTAAQNNNGTTAAQNSGTPTQATTAAQQTTRATQTPTTTTKPSGSTETTAKSGSGAASTGKNEYDILRSGKFYLVGSMYSEGENNPITLGVGDNLVYMQATMDGATMGFLVSNKKTYLLNPDQKTYCEFGSMMSSLLQQAGMMSEDEIMGYIDEMGFSTMEDLSQADSKTTGTIGSTNCDVYIFNKTDGTKTRVYMNGNKLMAFEMINKDGNVDSATYITTLSETVPKLPPADYTKQNVISFMSSMESVLGE